MGKVWDRRDGTFAVTIEERLDRPGYRIRFGFGRSCRVSKAAPNIQVATEAAELIWAQYAEGRLTAPDRPPETWSELVERFGERAELRPATRRSYERALRLTEAHFGAKPLQRLTQNDVKAWLATLTCGTESKRSYLRTVRACVRWAQRQNWLLADITHQLSIDGPRSAVRPWLGRELWPAFLAGCGTDASRVRFGFVLETGLRLAELLAARWEWLHTTIGVPAIRIAPCSTSGFVPKWGQARAVPLTDAAQRYLEEAKALWPGRTLIFQDDGRPLRDPKWARDVARACERAELPAVDLHGLRRSAGARWLQAGIPLHEVSRLLGHQDVTTTMRWYGGIADATLATRIGMLNSEANATPHVPSKRRANTADDV